MSNDRQMTHHLMESLKCIRLVLLDVDGVLTPGTKMYSTAGLVGLEFDTRDGLGVAMLQAAGCRVGVVSNGSSDIVHARAADLRLDIVILDTADKARSIEAEAFPNFSGVSWEETLMMGDDVWDVEAMSRASVAMAPNDAHTSATRAADYVTQQMGGHGAVREMADLVLEAKGIDPFELLHKV